MSEEFMRVTVNDKEFVFLKQFLIDYHDLDDLRVPVKENFYLDEIS